MTFFSKVALATFLCNAARIAATDYAVYFDPSQDARNPMQRSGSSTSYKPYSPSKWREVDKDAWPIFSDWGKILDEPGPWYERGNSQGNECEDRSNASYNDQHRQSPIMLQDDDACTDRHKLVNIEFGQCAKEEVSFYTTPYGLGATVKCKVQPLLDFSLNKDVWTLQEIVLKTPGEHSIWNPETGEEETFAGELHLGYKGSRAENVSRLDGHAENIGIVGIMLKVGNDYDEDDELEKLIRGWERSQQNQYDACGKTYNHDDCKLNSVDSRGRSLVEKTSLTSNKGIRGGTITSDNLSEKKAIQEQRELGEWHRQCPNSHYCFLNLYKHTETDYYYNYRGGLTYPPCTEIVYWRVMMQPMMISPGQLERIERLTYMHINNDCVLNTVGKRRSSKSCAVDVNRPRQALSIKHSLKRCDSWTTASVGSSVSDETIDDDAKDDDFTYSNVTSTSANNMIPTVSDTIAEEKKKSKGKRKKGKAGNKL